MPTYEKTVWENQPKQSTPIDASNLNKIEECLSVLCEQDVLNMDLMSGVGSGVVFRDGCSCQLDATIVNPISIGGSTDLFQFPDNFKPSVNFSIPVIGSNYGETLGIVVYDTITNMMTMRTTSQDAFIGKISFSYICST